MRWAHLGRGSENMRCTRDICCSPKKLCGTPRSASTRLGRYEHMRMFRSPVRTTKTARCPRRSLLPMLVLASLPRCLLDRCANSSSVGRARRHHDFSLRRRRTCPLPAPVAAVPTKYLLSREITLRIPAQGVVFCTRRRKQQARFSSAVARSPATAQTPAAQVYLPQPAIPARDVRRACKLSKSSC